MSNPVNLEAVLSRLDSLESKSNQAQEAKSNGGIWGWIVALVLGAVVSVGAGILIWQLNKKNEELAKLRTKTELDQLHAMQLEHSASTAKHTDVITRLETTAATLKSNAADMQTKITEQLSTIAQARERIAAIKNWDQLDDLNHENRS